MAQLYSETGPAINEELVVSAVVSAGPAVSAEPMAIAELAPLLLPTC